MSLVVVVPTYDERDNIARVSEAILARPGEPHLLVVDDGSPDGTADLVRDLAAARPGRVSLLERKGKDGLGRAYAAGFRMALDDLGATVVVQMDGDGSHDPADIDRLTAGLGRADLVIGSRYVDGGGVIGWARHRELLSRAGNVYARTVLASRVRDLTGGFKAWDAPLLRSVTSEPAASDGYAFQIEMTVRAASLGARIEEVPIQFRERVAGTSKMSARIAVEALRGVPAMRRTVRARQVR